MTKTPEQTPPGRLGIPRSRIGDAGGVWIPIWLEQAHQDVGYAFRRLRRNPGFGAAVVLTLALGIGAGTAIFTVVDHVLLRQLPLPDSDRLVMIWPTSGSRVSPGYLHDWRVESRTLQDLAGWHDVPMNLTGAGEPREVLVDRATPNFFSVLGLSALIGRTFTVPNDLSLVQAEAVLSHGLWQQHYGGDPTVIGQWVTLNGEAFTIIGVMPPGFTVRTVERSETRAELWVPLSLVPGDRVGMGGFLNAVARLVSNASIPAAQAELTAIARRIEAEHPSYSRDWGVNVIPLLDATVKDVRLALLVLLAAVGALLLIACANVSNLLLSHAASRRTELAIRLSLGASNTRLARQFLTEILFLAALGGGVAVLVSMWGTRILMSLLPAGLDLPRTAEIRTDVRIVAFAALLTLVTAMLVGLVPSLARLRSVPRQVTGSHRLLSAFVVSEVALALVLLAVAGLLGRSFWALTHVDPGFEPEHVLTVRTTLPASRYGSDGRIRAFRHTLMERIENLPGVRAVGFANYLPMSRFGSAGLFEIEGRPRARPQDAPFSWVTVVGGRYFDAMGIPLLRGRLPDSSMNELTQPVFVIDEELARQHWPNSDPVGARLSWRQGEFSGEVIGVVGSVRYGGMAARPQGTTYFWFPQDPGRQLAVVVRTGGDPTTFADLLAAQVRAIDPNQPVAEIRPMSSYVADDLAKPRFTMLLLVAFASSALLLAAVGLYGVIAFSVRQRTSEIGVRVALGAQRHDVVWFVMRHGLRLTGAGLAIGLAAALAAGRMAAGLLYGVTPTDPVTLVTVALFLAATASLSTFFPARRAARIDPMVALRYE